VAYLAQSLQLTPNFPLSVRDLVATGTYSNLGWFKPKLKTSERLEEALTTLNLQSIAERDVQSLSGGQLQRCLLARAIVQQASVFLLDEPFVGLDQSSRDIIEGFLFRPQPTFTVIMATHDAADLNHCQQTIALRQGEIQKSASSYA
jgi:iron/zinc/copper transport system ATP-binding protein